MLEEGESKRRHNKLHWCLLFEATGIAKADFRKTLRDWQLALSELVTAVAIV